jgi:hypothetical protein
LGKHSESEECRLLECDQRGSCKNRRFRGTCRLVSSSLILLTFTMEAISSSETSVLTRVTAVKTSNLTSVTVYRNSS